MKDEVEVPEILQHPLEPKEEQAAIAPPEERSDTGGLYLYGIVRARGWRGFERRSKEVQRVRYRDIEAVVKSTAFELPADRESGLKIHHETVESIMRRTTILPAPFGVVFRGRRPLIRLLQDQYLVLDEGLALLNDHWELRLYVNAAVVGEKEQQLSDDAMNIYTELRRFARAAVPFPSEGKRLLGAAFLVDRTNWVEFIERIEDFGEQFTELSFDVTGPWPAYDFVRIVT